MTDFKIAEYRNSYPNYQKEEVDGNVIFKDLYSEYHQLHPQYEIMQRYYEGEHDILYSYNKFAYRSNHVAVDNFVGKFINEEVQYVMGNPLTYTSASGNKELINDIHKTMFHWDIQQDALIMQTLEVYGKCYLLHYIDKKGKFCERVLSPLEGIMYKDEDDEGYMFIHFYKKKYKSDEYYDVYYATGDIETYCNDRMINVHQSFLHKLPVTEIVLTNRKDTIFHKIKSLQDSYNSVLSDQINTIRDYRNAYLVVTGVDMSQEEADKLQLSGLINLPSTGGGASWLVKDMPDTYIQNMLNNLKASMYSVTNHIDGNEKLQSNISGVALRSRLIFLEQRCNNIASIVINGIYSRLENMMHYLYLQNKKYEVMDVKVTATPCIPLDTMSVVQELVQLGIGENISLQTALSRLPFIENPLAEMALIKAEKKEREELELEKVMGLNE